MRFVVDEPQVLSLAVVLDVEPAWLDLRAGGLGDDLLDLAVAGMLQAHARRRSPAGVPWAELAASTVRRKGSTEIGSRTGAMLDPLTWEAGRRTIEARRAEWLHVDALVGGRSKGKLLGFHSGNPRTGQPARPLVGWTPGARARARARVAAAVGRGPARR